MGEFVGSRAKMYSQQQMKTGLCAFDDKRYILEDGHDTLAFGHYRINEPEIVLDSSSDDK